MTLSMSNLFPQTAVLKMTNTLSILQTYDCLNYKHILFVLRSFQKGIALTHFKEGRWWFIFLWPFGSKNPGLPSPSECLHSMSSFLELDWNSNILCDTKYAVNAALQEVTSSFHQPMGRVMSFITVKQNIGRCVSVDSQSRKESK